MSEPKHPAQVVGELAKQLDALAMFANRLSRVLEIAIGKEAYERADKQAEQEMREEMMRAQGRDPRVEQLAQQVQTLQETVSAIPSQLKDGLTEMFKNFAQMQKPAAPVPREPIFTPSAEDGGEFEGEDDEDEYIPPPPPRRNKKKGAAHNLPNSTRNKRMDTITRDGVRETAAAPGGATPQFIGSAHHDEGDDDGNDDGSE